MKNLFFLICLCISASAQASQLLRVETGDTWDRGTRKSVSYLNITALENNLIINRVESNRGNCESPNPQNTTLPKKLNFGQTLYMRPSWTGNPCNLIEVKVFTNKGVFTYNFK
jgi:hypothetical protein